MKKTLVLTIALHIAFYLTGQSLYDIAPEWEVSNGTHDHTSRDELHLSGVDKDGNTILAASVERDSSFADILIQKLSQNGAPLWEFSYSSGIQLDYDRPLKMMLDANNNIYLLCRSTYARAEGRGYVLRISQSGQLSWVKMLTEEVIPHHLGNFYDAYLDRNEQLQITYTCLADGWSAEPIFIGIAPTYFITLDSAGTVTQKFEKTGIGQPANSYAYAINEFIDTAGNFVFIMRDSVTYNQYYLRKIHPIQNRDTVITISQALLSEEEKISFNAIDWSFFRYNRNGDLYGMNNNPWGPINGFHYARISSDGLVRYARSSSSIFPLANVADFIATDSALFVTGEYGPDFQFFSNTYVWKLDLTGQLTDSITLTQNESLRPQRLIPFAQGFYCYAASQGGYSAYAYYLSDSLETKWVHQINAPAGYFYSGLDILQNLAGNLVATGTIGKRKHENSLFISENEVYAEQFTPQTPGFNWQYMHDDLGTSYVLSIRHADLGSGKVLVIAAEKTGPEVTLSGGSNSAPSKYYAYQYDASGALLSASLIPHQVNMDFFYKIAQTDGDGHIYVPCYSQNGNGMLLKMNALGETLDSMSIPDGIAQFLVTPDNRVLVASNAMSFNNAAFSNPQTFPMEGYAAHLFQLPNDTGIYTISVNNDSAEWQVAPRLILYRNGLQQWKYTVPQPLFDTEYIVYSTFDPISGRVFLITYSASQNNTRLHRIDLNGGNQTVTEPGDLFTSAAIYVLNNHSFYLYKSNQLTLYDTSLNVLADYFMPAASYNIVIQEENMYAFETGCVNVFDEQGNYKARFFSNDITYSTQYIDSAQQMYTIGSFGQNFNTQGGFPFGWRWYRGVLKKYDLFLLLSDTEEEDVMQPNSFSFAVFPNPAGSSVYFRMETPIAQNSSVKMTIYDSASRMVYCGDYVEKMNTEHWAAGSYHIVIQDIRTGRVAHKTLIR